MTEDKRVAWLREQITARLEAAKTVGWKPGEDVPREWVATQHKDLDFTIEARSGLACHGMADLWREDVACFIADNDPQDVIARCEAELSILQRHQERSGACTEDEREWPCGTVRFTASGYKYKSGYEERWGGDG